MWTPAQLIWSRPGLPDDPQNQSYHDQSVCASGDKAEDDDMLDVKPDIQKLKELLQFHTSRVEKAVPVEARPLAARPLQRQHNDQSVCASGDKAEDDDMLDVKPDIRRLKELLQYHTSRVEKAVPASVSGLRRIEIPKPAPAQKTTVSPPVIRFLKPRRGSPIRRRRSDEENVGWAALRCDEKLFQPRKDGSEKDTRPLKMPTVKVEPMDEDEAPPVLSKMVQNPVNVKAEVFDGGYGDAGQTHRQVEARPLAARPLQRQPQPYHRAIFQPRLPTVIRPILTPPREPIRFTVIHTSSHLLPPPKTGFIFSIKSAPPRQPTPPPPPKPKPPPKALIKDIILKKLKPPPKPPKPKVLGPNGEPRKRGRPRIHPVKPKSDPPRKRGRPRKYPPGSKRPRQPTPPPPPKPKPPPKALIKHIILKKLKPPPKPPKPKVLGPNGEPRKRGRPRIHPVKPKSDPPRKRGRPRKYPPGSKRPRQPPSRKALRFNSQVRDRSIDWSNYDESKAFIDKEVHVLGEQRTFKLCSSCLDALYEENTNKYTLRSHFSRCRGELKKV